MENNGYVVDIIDARVELNWKERLRDLADGALMVGITAITGPQVHHALKASQAVRDIDSDLPIVWGGWHATFLSEATITHPLVDYTGRRLM